MRNVEFGMRKTEDKNYIATEDGRQRTDLNPVARAINN